MVNFQLVCPFNLDNLKLSTCVFFNMEIFEMSWSKFGSLMNFKWNVGGHRVVGDCNGYGVKAGCTL